MNPTLDMYVPIKQEGRLHEKALLIFGDAQGRSNKKAHTQALIHIVALIVSTRISSPAS